MIGPARVAAYDAGMAVSSGRQDLSEAVAASRRTLHDDRDKHLAAEIAIGVQRWRGALDHVVTHFSRRPIDRLDPEVVEILRLGAYQLLHLSRVPASAVVDDAVKLTGRAGKRSASGLVNAVLRSISRGRQKIAGMFPPRPADPADRAAALDYLAITLSHPRWLVERWYGQYGFVATEQWLLFNNAPAPLTLRAHEARATPDLVERLGRHDVVVRRGRYAPDALIVERGQPLSAPGVDPGWFAVQDEASQLVTQLAGVEPGGLVLDTCASPGGKATALAARLSAGGTLVACDVRDRRIDLLQRIVASSGARNIRLVQADLLHPLPFRCTFDSVFVDAPCSGLGILRRDPDIKWRRRESDLAALGGNQLTMLKNAADCVRPGGRLIYATCSSEVEENESVIAAFREAAPAFADLDVRDAAPSVPPEVVDGNGHFHTYPFLHGLEAFFGAVFTKGA